MAKAESYPNEFLEEERAFFHERNRVGTTWAAIAWPLFVLLDWAVYPEHIRLFVFLRLAVEVVLLTNFFLTYTDASRRYPQIASVIEYIAICSVVIVMTHVTGGYRSPYYAGLILVLLFLIYIYPVDLKGTILINALILLGYLVPIFIRDKITDPALLITKTTFISGVLFFMIMSTVYAKKMRFKAFVTRSKLAKANNELKELDKIKSQFFANISHEVRTPLTSIIAPLQSLRQGDAGELITDQRELVDQMHRNAIRLLDLINQMLDFSKLEAGKVHLRLQLASPQEVLFDVVSLFEEVTERKGLFLKFESKSEVRDVYLDVDRMERILTNLIRNAIKFSDTGGITVSLAERGDNLVIKVMDTGIGIPDEQLNYIFQRFGQVEDSTARLHEGTGLGLAIVKESVDLMRGDITVDSELGQGSIFTMTLPMNLEELEPHAFIERRQKERRRRLNDFNGDNRRADDRRKTDFSQVPVTDLAQLERLTVGLEKRDDLEETDIPNTVGGDNIVLAEDNDDLRIYVTKMLRKMGHNVTPTADGEAALEKIFEIKPDLLVSDIQMPKKDGYQVLDALRKNLETADLPVILITAKPGEDPKMKALGIGADDYLPKPINVRELDARIRNLITGRKFQRAAAEASALDERMEELRQSFAQSLEMRDFETGNHSRDVLILGTLIADQMGVAVDRTLKDALLLHDIGKIGIPDRILLKSTHLDEQEWRTMRKHPEFGYSILVNFPSFHEVSEIILAHQEHYDGTGYPRSFKGDEIPMAARIIAVADAYHAMTNDRPYRRAMNHEEAMDELKANRGTQFDPAVVDAFFIALATKGPITLSEKTIAEKDNA